MAIIPLYDRAPTVRRPFVTFAFILVCIVLYFAANQNFEIFTLRNSDIFSVDKWYRFVSYGLMHVDVMHLFGNMLFMWIFANNVEEVLNHKYFALFLLVATVFSGLSEIIFQSYIIESKQEINLLGASGTVAGVMGAYLRLFPKAKIMLLVVIMPLAVPAWVALGAWIMWQFIQVGGSSHVAYMAHISGFIFGFLTLHILLILRPAWLIPWLKLIKGKNTKRRQSSLPDS